MQQDYLNNEIELASKIFMFYSDRMLDYLKVSSYKYKQWYLDSLQLSYLLALLKSIWFNGTTPYIGYKEIAEQVILNTFYKVREYYISDIDSEYVETVITDIVIPKSTPVYIPFIGLWKELYITITENATQSITLPFTYINADPASVIISIVGSQDPIGISPDNEPGYRIENNTFYWNTGNYYDLNIGDTIYIKYYQIKE